jgi:hypothetical protein
MPSKVCIDQGVPSGSALKPLQLPPPDFSWKITPDQPILSGDGKNGSRVEC